MYYGEIGGYKTLRKNKSKKEEINANNFIKRAAKLFLNTNKNTKHKNQPIIIPLPNGPLYLINDRKSRIIENLENSRGEKLSSIIGIALCRCGASKNKPFCDGSHSSINFIDEKN